jgi:hypothetical protein
MPVVYQNIGFEFLINAVPIKTPSVTWKIDVSFSDFKSKVEKLDVGVTNIFLGGFTTPNIRLVEGDDTVRYMEMPTRGILNQVKVIVGANGLPLITSGVQKIGNPNPDYIMGITNTLTVKGFTLTALFDFKRGGAQYSRNLADLQRNGVAKETAEFARFDGSGNPTKPYLFDAVLCQWPAKYYLCVCTGLFWK